MAQKAHPYEAKFFRVFPIYLTIHPDSGVSWGVKSVGIPAAPIFHYFRPFGHGVTCYVLESLARLTVFVEYGLIKKVLMYVRIYHHQKGREKESGTCTFRTMRLAIHMCPINHMLAAIS